MWNPIKFLFRGIFRQKGKSLLRYVLKTSSHACEQHTSIKVPPLGSILDNILIDWRGALNILHNTLCYSFGINFIQTQIAASSSGSGMLS